ncbi:hypothetical protein BCR33DRAFT_854101 [Rhizoclosmatium globosum]|uniref:Uncharacterized protein n=1 Tax=Rhizoclosmatium globosum TaxID=329046 RepID=A0A1Y2BUK1_9FUNG|nr:hypothetical protein BCR33DRAFT_854101 [Rhizoclosmatium globosum]|eukprot:ORY38448.1 hypothetical protein BCR33DRAFT_854101 [Rhizoclosmatium globosum]
MSFNRGSCGIPDIVLANFDAQHPYCFGCIAKAELKLTCSACGATGSGLNFESINSEMHFCRACIEIHDLQHVHEEEQVFGVSELNETDCNGCGCAWPESLLYKLEGNDFEIEDNEADTDGNHTALFCQACVDQIIRDAKTSNPALNPPTVVPQTIQNGYLETKQIRRIFSEKECCRDADDILIWSEPGEEVVYHGCKDCIKYCITVELFWRNVQYGDIQKELVKAGITESNSDSSFRRYLKSINLKRRTTAEEKVFIEAKAKEWIKYYRETVGIFSGYRNIWFDLRFTHHIPITRDRVLALLNEMEPSNVLARTQNRLKRRNYTGKGPFEKLAFDQHDKFRIYRLFVSGGIECWSRYMAWFKVWKSNRQGPLVHIGGENNYLAWLQTTMRTELEPTATPEQVNKFHRVVLDSRLNQKIECWWSHMLYEWGNDILDLLALARERQLYDPTDPLEGAIFQFLAIPYYQQFFDEKRRTYNARSKRAQWKRNLPSGYLSSPSNLMSNSSDFGGIDHRIRCPIGYLAKKMAEIQTENSELFSLFPENVLSCLRHARALFPGTIQQTNDIWPILRGMVRYMRETGSSTVVVACVEGEVDMHSDQDTELSSRLERDLQF